MIIEDQMSTHTDHTPKTILIYTYADVVGDGFVKLPFLRDLRARFPDAHITWCAGVLPTVYAGVLKSLTQGYLDEVLSAAGLGTGIRELFSFRRPLGGPFRFADLYPTRLDSHAWRASPPSWGVYFRCREFPFFRSPPAVRHGTAPSSG
jgi:hypothetical protein